MFEIRVFLDNDKVKVYKVPKPHLKTEFGFVSFDKNYIMGLEWLILTVKNSQRILFLNTTLFQTDQKIVIYSEKVIKGTAANRALYSDKEYKVIKLKCKHYKRQSKLGMTPQEIIDWKAAKNNLIVQKFYKTI